MSTQKEDPDPPLRGLRHLALRVADMAKSRKFYEETLGMKVVWAPDTENIYLSSGSDNLALHQIAPGARLSQGEGQPLDHFGWIVENEAAVDGLAAKMEKAGVAILKRPRRHRDGSYSFYMADPDGNVIQILYEPHISRRP
ncbi:MAG TPA: VOC family protein [Candidatus Manganitrophaceae bacterium]|nr:VOC family protein [Candidatus Manganitrophaceae bacterium]